MILFNFVWDAGVWILRGLKCCGGPMGFELWGSCFQGRDVCVLESHLELYLETSEMEQIK